METHHQKLKNISGYTEADIQFLKRTLFHHLEFIDPKIIGAKNWKLAYDLTKDVDEKGTPFVALAIETNGFLWTGDKKLIHGLSKKGWLFTFTTDELFLKRG